MNSNDLSLNGQWRLTCDDGRTFPATVPGDVILDLMRAGAISDPNIRDNFRECRELGEHIWSYEKDFSLRLHPGTRYILWFDGLAYVAEILVNGTPAGHHKSMHRPCRLDITALLRDGENHLEVRLNPFDSGIKAVPLVDFHLTGWSDAIYDRTLCRKRGAGRKADYTYGWDWAQGLPVCGIWRDCGLEILRFARIRDPHIQAGIDGTVRCMFTLESVLTKLVDGMLRLTVRHGGQIAAQKEVPAVLGPGCWEYEQTLRIDNPALWYPRGYGEQPMYELEISISHGGEETSRNVRFAFRKVELDWRNIAPEQDVFRFLVNGVRVFAKGANWIPADIIPGRVTRDHLRTLLELAAAAEMNYLRIWGGGCYEQELFYELCDEFGIMVWQDFMFGGPEVPDFDPAFRAECRLECETVLKRLRNHPCIILWCGSNETDGFYADVCPRRRPNHYAGWRLFHRDFPEIVRKFAPDALYLPSCPSPGKCGGRPNAPGVGTFHGNPAAHQYASDAEFDAEAAVPAFDNELYGVSGDPASSLHRYLADGDLDSWENPVLRDHHVLDLQRNDEWGLFFRHLTFGLRERGFEYPVRQSLAFFAEAHCELIRRYLEFLRRKRELCGGAAFWMYNNAYPMMGWGVVDYYGTPKAAWYALKRSCRAVLPIIAVYDEKIIFHVSNDTARMRRGKLRAGCIRFTGETVFRREIEVEIPAGATAQLLCVDRGECAGADPAECFILAELAISGEETVRNHRFLVSPRELRLPEARLSLRPEPENPGTFILESSRFAAGVVLSPWEAGCYPDDNGFDLYPGIPKRVRFTGPVSAPAAEWKNPPGREPYVCGFRKEKCCSGTEEERWFVTLYNPAPDARTVVPEAESALCRVSKPSALELPPESVATFELAVSPEPLHDYPFRSPVDLRIGGEVIREGCSGLFPGVMTRGAYHSGVSFSNPDAVTYHGVHCNGMEFERKVRPEDANAAPSPVMDFSVPPDLIPYRSELRRGRERLFSFWEDAMPFSEFRKKLHFASGGRELEAFPFSGSIPEPVLEGSGISFRMGSPEAPWLFRGGESSGELLLFLFYRERRFYLDLFVTGVPFRQRFSGEAVFQDSCVELLLGYSDNSVFRDYSLAQTVDGPQIFLRRGSGEFPAGLRTRGHRLSVFHSPTEALQLYRLELDTEEEGMPELLTGKEFRIGMVVRVPGNNGVTLFNGIGIGIGCTDAATVRIRSDRGTHSGCFFPSINHLQQGGRS